MAEYSETNYYEVQIDDIAAGGGYGDLQDYMNDMASLANATLDNAERAEVASDKVSNMADTIEQTTREWLDEHPEATTTVVDGSISEVKLADSLKRKILDSVEIFTIATPIRAYCTAIIDKDGGCVLLDMSSTTVKITPTASMSESTDLVCDASAPYVISALNGKITNVDAVVLSHYHYDHLGNYQELFGSSGLPCNGTTFYIPKIPNVIAGAKGVSQDLHDQAVEFNEWLVTRGFTAIIPNEGQSFSVGGLNLTFHNCDADYWETKAATPSEGYTYEYNDTSICTLVECGKGRLYGVGDGYWNLQKWLVDNEYAEEADILLAPHHGLAANIYPDFVSTVAPSIVIGQFGNPDLLTEFVANKYPDIPAEEKAQVENKLNMYIGMRNYFSAISNWCSERNIPYVDTIDNESFSINLDSVGGARWSGLKPYIGDGELHSFASPSDALFTKEATFETTTGIKDLLESMPENSHICSFFTNAYQIVKDLKLPNYDSGTSRTYIIQITKYTGSRRNHLDPAPSFEFIIDAIPKVGVCDDRFTFIGRRSESGTWSANMQKYVAFNMVYMGGTADASTHIYSMTPNATRSACSEVFNILGATFKVLRSGLYRVTMTGTNVNDTIVLENTSGSVKSTHVLTGGTSNTQLAVLASNETYRIKSTSTTNALTVWIEWMGNSATAEFPNN